jgi:hypothetical protein
MTENQVFAAFIFFACLGIGVGLPLLDSWRNGEFKRD